MIGKISKLLIILLLVLIFYMIYNGCNNSSQKIYYTKLIEGHANKGVDYLKKLKEKNDIEIKKIVKNIDSTQAGTKQLSKLRQLTTLDDTITAAIKTKGGSSLDSISKTNFSSMFGGDKDKDTDGNTDDNTDGNTDDETDDDN